MKKLFVTLLLITAVAAGSMFAQTATTSSTGPSEEKKVELKNGSKAQIRKNAAAKNHENVSKHKRLQHKKSEAAAETKKDKVRDHKDEMIEKAGGKAEAKQMLKKKQMQRKEDKKDE